MTERFIPASYEELTPEWLTEALTESGLLKGKSVIGIKAETIGSEQGYVGQLTRLYIEYDRPDETTPATMIMKVPTKEKKNRMIMEAFWNYERENRTYEELLDHLPLRTPRCYFSAFDLGYDEKTVNAVYRKYGTLSKGLVGLYFFYVAFKNTRLKRRYLLLLEDFKALDQIDQREGCSFEEAKRVVKSVGLGQAAFWKNPVLDQYWLKAHVDMSNMMGFLAARGIPVLTKTFSEKVTPRGRQVFNWLKANNGRLDEYVRNRPVTLVHTDVRLDNIFFDRDKNEIALIDWQAVCPGLGLFDPCFFLLTNGRGPFTPDQAEALIKEYHQGLTQGGVTDYGLEECLSDYPYGLMTALRYMLIIIGGLEVKKNPHALKMGNLWFDRMKSILEGIDLSRLFR